MHINEIETFTDALSLLFLNEKIILIGDFNLPNFYNNTVTCVKSASFHNLCDILNLKQYNSVRNNNNNMLDLVFTNFLSINTAKSDFPLVSEDLYHPALIINCDLVTTERHINFPTANNYRYNFKKADFKNLYEYICNVDWSHINNFVQVDEALNEFYRILYEALDKFVPTYRCCTSNFPPWFTFEIKSNLKTKEYFRKKWIKTRQLTYYDEFKRLRTLIKNLVKTAYEEYIDKVENNIKSNPSEFWKYVNLKQGCSRIPGTVTANDIVYNKPHDIVNAFATVFSDFFTDSSSFDPNNDKLHNNHPSITIGCITENDLISLMSKLQNKNNCGVDKIPDFLIKDCRFILAAPLSVIINLAIKTSTFPLLWKQTRIIPVHKKGDKSNVCNYRPIAILNNFSKLFEMIIYNTLLTHTRSFISNDQHGYMTGRSTVTNLACFSQYVSEVIDNRG